MANRLLTAKEISDIFRAAFLEYTKHVTSDGAAIGARTEPPVMPEAARAACDHCFHHVAVRGQVCCWCGKPWSSRHGPYVPEGDR